MKNFVFVGKAKEGRINEEMKWKQCGQEENKYERKTNWRKRRSSVIQGQKWGCELR